MSTMLGARHPQIQPHIISTHFSMHVWNFLLIVFKNKILCLEFLVLEDGRTVDSPIVFDHSRKNGIGDYPYLFRAFQLQ